jgi:hypothetical protein
MVWQDADMPETISCPECGGSIEVILNSARSGCAATCPECNYSFWYRPGSKAADLPANVEALPRLYPESKEEAAAATPSPMQFAPKRRKASLGWQENLSGKSTEPSKVPTFRKPTPDEEKPEPELSEETPDRERRYLRADDRLAWEARSTDSPKATDQTNSAEKAHQEGGTKRFFLFLGAGVLLLLGFEVVFGFAWRSVSRDEPVPLAREDLPPPAGTPPPKPPMRLLTDAAIESMTAFLNARDVDELLEHVRNRTRIGKTVRKYYADHPFVPLGNYTAPLPGDLKRSNGFFSVSIYHEGKFLRLQADESQDYKIDWESFVAYGEMDWDEFLATKPKTPTLLLVKIHYDDYYNYDFTQKDFTSLRVMHPDGSRELFAYANCGTLAEKKSSFPYCRLKRGP